MRSWPTAGSVVLVGAMQTLVFLLHPDGTEHVRVYLGGLTRKQKAKYRFRFQEIADRERTHRRKFRKVGRAGAIYDIHHVRLHVLCFFDPYKRVLLVEGWTGAGEIPASLIREAEHLRRDYLDALDIQAGRQWAH